MEEILIEEVKKRNFLYDVRSSYYRDHNRRAQAWKEIGRILQLKPDVAKYTWEKLRRCFSNAQQRRKNWKFSIERRKRTPWKYEAIMSFLLGVTDTKTPVHKPTVLQISVNHEQNEFPIQKTENFPTEESKLKTSDINSVALQVKNSSNYDVSCTQINELSSSNRRTIDNENNKTVTVENIKQEIEDTYNSEKLAVKIQNFEEQFDGSEQFKIATYTHCLLDETDMFFLSLSKTTKTLQPRQQAEIKLLVSQAVLRTQLAEEESCYTQYS
ncbi:hypothetical protein WA026_003452 [Henosepilachna vigintioctopunctata]|uniref:MADF domain-containing protein n=1 Tax=Henosepilachna vigintioctopunctata TaxID=420089 RepID=A0AAW1TM53_9CUCU